MNKWCGIGRTTREIELRYSQNNTEMAICSFTLAVNRMKKGEADFISCKAFGKTAETIAKFVEKGRMIGIEGRIQTGSYDKDDGTKIYTTDVIVDRMHFVGNNSGESQTQDTAQQGDAYEPNPDLPF